MACSCLHGSGARASYDNHSQRIRAQSSFSVPCSTLCALEVLRSSASAALACSSGSTHIDMSICPCVQSCDSICSCTSALQCVYITNLSAQQHPRSHMSAITARLPVSNIQRCTTRTVKGRGVLERCQPHRNCSSGDHVCWERTHGMRCCAACVARLYEWESSVGPAGCTGWL